MMSYQYKFQDDDQTKIKGSVKYVLKEQQRFLEDILSLDVGWFVEDHDELKPQQWYFYDFYVTLLFVWSQIRFLRYCGGVRCRAEDQPTQHPGSDRECGSTPRRLPQDQVSGVSFGGAAGGADITAGVGSPQTNETSYQPLSSVLAV